MADHTWQSASVQVLQCCFDDSAYTDEPNKISRASAIRVLTILQTEQRIPPYVVCPAVDGGITIQFRVFDNEKETSWEWEFYNNGHVWYFEYNSDVSIEFTNCDDAIAHILQSGAFRSSPGELPQAVPSSAEEGK